MSKLKSWRESKGLTQQQLADQVGVHVQYISAIERGARSAGMRVATRLRDLSGGVVSLDDLAPKRQPSQRAA
jgi:transcriptional regulator with XRE-family HTH domain